MAAMELSPEKLFRHFPEPVLLVEGSLVHYCNPSAQRLFPGLKVGEQVPEGLSDLLEQNVPPFASGGVRISGKAYLVSLEAIAEKLLVVLRSDGRDEALPGLERLAVSLRKETTGLAAALQRMDPRDTTEEAKLKKYLSAANQGVYRLLRLADHLEFLDQEDSALYQPVPLDLVDFCGGLARKLESLCTAAGYQFSYETECASLLTVGDEALLRRLILSLISNAMKAVGTEGKLGLRLSLSGVRAVFTVWDNGPGLPEGELYHLFEMQSTQTTGTNPAEGLGIGLETARRVAGLHGGTIMVEDRPGEGLRVMASIPVKPSESAPLYPHAQDRLYNGGFSPLMVELSDVLPVRLFSPEELE